MNFRIVFYLISYLVFLEGIAMAFSSLVAFFMNDPLSDILELLACGFFTVAVGALGALLTRNKSGDIRTGSREGFAVVAFGWIMISIFGALPFIAVVKMHWIDALFETVSGFTTTGATVIDKSLMMMDGTRLSEGIESLPSGILFWRSLTHWIGGMGIVMFSLAILPMLGIGGQALYNAEVPGVKTVGDQFTPRIASTAKILCIVYVILTLLETFLLYFGGMPLFDSVCHSFGTISTGGFSTKNLSIAFYRSSYIQSVIILFMFLGGCNFLLLFRIITGLSMREYLNEEFRTYVMILLTSTLIVGAYLFFSGIVDPISGENYHHDFWLSLRASLFQVVSLSTTTGFTTSNFAIWPAAACIILLGLMFMGGCGGSTAGGIKCVRIILLCKFSVSELRKNIFPRSLPNIRLNGKRFDITATNRVLGFFMIYIFTGFAFILLLTLTCSMTPLTAITASITCLSNVGPALGALAPDCTYAWMTPAAKFLLSAEMLIGRLELYTVLIFLLPSFWKK